MYKVTQSDIDETLVFLNGVLGMDKDELEDGIYEFLELFGDILVDQSHLAATFGAFMRADGCNSNEEDLAMFRSMIGLTGSMMLLGLDPYEMEEALDHIDNVFGEGPNTSKDSYGFSDVIRATIMKITKKNLGLGEVDLTTQLDGFLEEYGHLLDGNPLKASGAFSTYLQVMERDGYVRPEIFRLILKL